MILSNPYTTVRHSEALRGLLLAILVIIGTFPENDWSYSTGIDPSLFWVFNHLFETGLPLGKHIIFPHGPLAFFMYPLSDNILIATLVSSILKGLLVFNVFWVCKENKNQTNWLVAFAFAYLVSLMGNFNHLILTNLILLYCNYYLSNFKPFKFLAFFITAFAFFVKAYVAIVAGTLFFSFVLFFLIQNRKLKSAFIDSMALLGFILLFWLLMFASFRGFINFVWGMLHLAQDNSSAAAYYPQNNWLILVLCFISLICIFLVGRSKRSYFFSVLIALSLFASWKHGMAREDIYHTKGLLIYLMISLTAYLLFEQKQLGTKLILLITTLFLFNANQRNAVNYFPDKYQLFRVNNFVEFVSNFEELKERSDQKSAKLTAGNILPKSIRETISNTPVDIYPWDYSIAGINNLKWQPRVVIQSYAAYTSWLDKQNAQHFSSNKAPKFLLWETQKGINEINNCPLSSLDNRYLLNDEPQTIIQFIRSYQRIIEEGKFSLYKKRETQLNSEANIIKTEETSWGKWVKTPEFTKELLRVKLKSTKNLKQRLKSFFYKDEQCWIYLKTGDNSIHKFRIVPKNAKDGLWINPYVFENDKFLEIKEIMLKSSNQNMLSQNLTLEWEEIGFNEPEVIANFFCLNRNSNDSLIYSNTHDFEQAEVINWSNVSKTSLSDTAFSGKQAHKLSENPFSATFLYNLDTIPQGELKITADAWVYTPDYKQSRTIWLVMTNEKDGETDLYQRIAIDDQLIDRKQWNHISKTIDYKHDDRNNTLRVYFWNTGEKELTIDDFRIQIHARQ